LRFRTIQAHKARFAHVTTLVLNLDNGPESHNHRTQFMARLVAFVQRERVSVTLQPAPVGNGAASPVPPPEARRLEGDIGYVRPSVYICAGDACNQLATAMQCFQNSSRLNLLCGRSFSLSSD